MRPVNLIPHEKRLGQRRAMRGGPLAYIVVGALALALIGVVLLVTTSNQISESKVEIAELQSEKATVEAEAAKLAPYTQFHDVSENRVATITSLADSRFDWQRVLRELSLVLPANVWLTNVAASASGESASSGSAGVAMRSSISGPALELVGCATGQEAVAGFIQALKEIDGATRVGMQSSSLGNEGEGGGGGGESGASCQTRNFIAQFQMVVAFDAAPVASESSAIEEPVPSPGETAEASGEATSENASTESTAE
jgi:Tfp pilus assembly protein PilN